MRLGCNTGIFRPNKAKFKTPIISFYYLISLAFLVPKKLGNVR
jgi:hypothetical protein